ncbi:MAG: MBL fold metallo-hydrolase [Rhodospirillales bacterium]|nr:MBL fold metallo-hydrolase [Rhodospirillales bacterium]
MSSDNQSLTLGDFTLTVVVTDPPYFENCYLVKHDPSGDQIAIDPGSAAKKILDQVQADGGNLKAIWLTHGHPDHIGAVKEIQEKTGVSCLAHKDEKQLIENAPVWAQSMGMSVEGPSSCDYYDSDVALTLGGSPVKVVETPGHTPGGVCYDFGEFVITGDTLFCQGIGRTDFPGGNSQQLASSITNLLSVVDDQSLLFSGHGPEWKADDAERWWKAMF